MAGKQADKKPKKKLKDRLGGLTPQQRMFVKQFLVDLHAEKAAVRAGYSEKSARVYATKLMSDPKIQEAIRKAMRQRERRVEIKSDQVLQEIAVIAFSDIGQLIEWGPDGIRIKDSSEVQDTRMVQEISSTTSKGETNVKIKLYDKLNALGMLGKHFNLFKGSVDDPNAVHPLQILANAIQMSQQQLIDRKAAQQAEAEEPKEEEAESTDEE